MDLIMDALPNASPKFMLLIQALVLFYFNSASPWMLVG